MHTREQAVYCDTQRERCYHCADGCSAKVPMCTDSSLRLFGRRRQKTGAAPCSRQVSLRGGCMLLSGFALVDEPVAELMLGDEGERFLRSIDAGVEHVDETAQSAGLLRPL